MPAISRVMAWLASSADMYGGFREQYAHARDAQADLIFDKLADVSADETIDVQRARLIVDTEKWRLARMKPKKYGTDRVQHVGDADQPLTFTVRRVSKREPDAS